MPTIITRTIDAGGGGDYTTFTAAEAAVVTLVTTDDMVANDEAIVFECVAGTYNEFVTFDSSSPGPALTTDATRNITYRAAAGSEHGGVAGAGVVIDSGGSGIPTTLVDDFTVVDGFNLTTTTSYCAWLEGAGTVVRNCIASATDRGFIIIGATSGDPAEVSNCVSLGGSGYAFYVLSTPTVAAYGRIVNCVGETTTTTNSVFRAQQASGGVPPEAEFVNCLALSFRAFTTSGTTTTTGSNNVGVSTNPWPAALQAESQTWTFTTDPQAASTGSQVIYDATTGALVNAPGNDAVGVGTTTGVPTTDINGADRIRGTYADPGAFTAELRTITKSIIGSGGGDYTTFTAAEAAVSSLVTDADMVKRNEAVVFEAVSGTYNETVTFDSSSPGPALTMDATRNITYRAAAGSENGGAFGAGVNLVGARVTVLDPYVNLLGLSVSATSTPGIKVEDIGVVVDSCAVTSALRGVEARTGTVAAPIVVRNCNIRTPGHALWAVSVTGLDVHVKAVNNTFESTGDHVIRLETTDAANTTDAELTNNVCFGLAYAIKPVGGAVTATGSNNVGGATKAFPAGLQALSQTWTFTTNTGAASTGSQVIYDASNGAMVNAAGNDAWKILTDLSVAPTTDIEGVTREATGYNPGAFERTAAEVGTPLDGGVDYLRDLNIRDRFLRGVAIREPFLRNLRG